jgi:hypothetical protein
MFRSALEPDIFDEAEAEAYEADADADAEVNEYICSKGTFASKQVFICLSNSSRNVRRVFDNLAVPINCFRIPIDY